MLSKLTGSQSLELLFSPSSLAIVGASNYTPEGGRFLLEGLIENSFQGALCPVNPRESEILGPRSYPTVIDISGAADLAIIAVSVRLVPQILSECGQKGAKFAVIHSAGFAKPGVQGEALEKEMLDIAMYSGMRFLGPNHMGLCCPEVRLNTIRAGIRLTDKPESVAFLGQSSWVCRNLTGMGNERSRRYRP